MLADMEQALVDVGEGAHLLDEGGDLHQVAGADDVQDVHPQPLSRISR